MDQSRHSQNMAKLCKGIRTRNLGKFDCTLFVLGWNQQSFFLQAKKNSVIDNTNSTKDARKRYIDVAKKLGIRCRCFVMDVSFAQSKHNNIFRELTDSTHKPINDIVMNSFK